MRIKNKIGIITLASIIGLGLYGCEKPKEPNYITGTVLKEFGTIVDRQKIIESSEGAIFGNDSIKIGESYGIQFKADYNKKNYIFAVKKTSVDKLEALNFAIEKGTRIEMKRYDFNRNLRGIVGQIEDYKLEVLRQE